MTKRRKPIKTTTKTTEFLRERGYEVANVEKFVQQIRQRKDAFGWIDLLAIRPSTISPTIGIQCCADDGGSGVSAHMTKLEGLPLFRVWTMCEHRAALIFAWGRRAGTGRMRITPRVFSWWSGDWKDVTEVFVAMPITNPKPKKKRLTRPRGERDD